MAMVMRKLTAGNFSETATVAPVDITKLRKPRAIVVSVVRHEAPTKGGHNQVPVSVADMPEELSKLWDKGVEDHFRGR